MVYMPFFYLQKHGVKDWVAVASEFNDPARDRYRCRLRFHSIYKHFKRCPDKSLDSLGERSVFKRAAKRQKKIYSSLEAKIEDWIKVKDEAAVISNIPIPSIDLNESTTLSNGKSYKNRVLSQFIRHLQTILPVVEHVPLAPLPPAQLRSLPDKKPPPFLQTLKAAKRKRPHIPKKKLKPKRGQSIKTEFELATGETSTKLPVKTIMDREMSKLFRSSYLKAGRSNLNPGEIGILNLAVKNLDKFLDFSDMKSNLDPSKFTKFSPCEEKLLDHYWFQSEISVAEVNAGPSNALVSTGVSGPLADSSYRIYGSKRPAQQGGDKDSNPDVAGMNIIMPTKPTLVGFRGALLHADYTAELASQVDPDTMLFAGKNSHLAAQKELRLGLNSSHVRSRQDAGKQLFRPIYEASVSVLLAYALNMCFILLFS